MKHNILELSELYSYAVGQCLTMKEGLEVVNRLTGQNLTSYPNQAEINARCAIEIHKRLDVLEAELFGFTSSDDEPELEFKTLDLFVECLSPFLIEDITIIVDKKFMAATCFEINGDKHPLSIYASFSHNIKKIAAIVELMELDYPFTLDVDDVIEKVLLAKDTYVADKKRIERKPFSSDVPVTYEEYRKSKKHQYYGLKTVTFDVPQNKRYLVTKYMAKNFPYIEVIFI